ncbi:MAG TPA: succinate dehydrogenase, hydrophobic membrane anchor protein [Alphaproteobacteria bacterium]|jgi:succinate dehydrogenase / fumarate reductase membrane anchor subunit|nr:succinate dehydrogenase, hydrophobic membrane anchor protein [Alphaproteobacteria bacterium]
MVSHHPQKRLAGPLARARGLGSAKHGLQHWWTQRVSAVALVPLTLWFVYSVVHLTGADQARVHAWLSRPATAILMSLFIVATFYHLALGVQVVIEDYVHREGVKLTTMLLVKGLIVLTAAAALFAVLRVAVGS